MTSRLRLVLLALVLAVTPANSQQVFMDRCVRIVDDDEQFICNNDQYRIISTPSEAVHIMCRDTKLNCLTFPSINLANNSSLKHVSVIKCGLVEPVACFLGKLHIADADRLRLEELLTPIAANHFVGLRATTVLNIYVRESLRMQTFPYETFAMLPHLKRAEIHGLQLLEPGLLQAPFLTTLWLSSDSISELPPGSFQGFPSLNKLMLHQNRIVYINNDTFSGLNKVRMLNLNENRISELRGGALSSLRILEYLFIAGNPLRRLHDGFLQGLDYLTTVIISSSEPLKLDPRTFADLRSLRRVILEKCRLQELPGTVFKGSKAIQILKLSDNQLERLHPDVFRDQIEMTELDLSKNRVTDITSDLFMTLKKLEKLDISSNQLEIFPDALFSVLTRLQTLSLAHNKLRHIGATAFQGVPLRSPQLSITPKERNEEYYGTVYCPENGLTRVQILDKYIDDICHIWSLVAEQNSSRYVVSKQHPSEFPFFGKHVTVDFRDNNISTVSLGSISFPLWNTPAYFILDQNPLDCDCHIYPFSKIATSSNHTQYSLESSRCIAPPIWLEGTGLTQVSLDEFVCQVKCPSVCNCTEDARKGVVEAVCSEVSAEPSRMTTEVSLKFTRKPKSLRHLSFNNVVKIDLSGLHLNEIDFGTLPETVKLLNLSNNNLNYLPNDAFAKDVHLTLSDNPLFCDCWNKEHVTELQQNSVNILDYPALRCKDGTLLRQVDVQRICDVWKATVIGVTLTVLGVICLLFTVVIYKYSFEVKVYLSKHFPYLLPEEKYDASKKYDVFISYAHQDEDFVRDTLLPKLEGPPINVKTCIHSRDWIAGEMIPYNIVKSVEESRRTVIVLSENFLKSVWGLLEFRAAHVQASREGRTRVVVILLDDFTNCEEMDKEIKAYLRTNTYIKWGEPWFWEKLAYSLPKRGKIVDRREEKRLQSVAFELAKTGLDGAGREQQGLVGECSLS